MDEYSGESLRPIASMLVPVSGSLVAGQRLDGTEPAPAAALPRRFKILHILRAPVGGLFRHVVDLAQGQAERGHLVGLIVDSLTGGARADAVLAQLAPQLALGVERVAIARQLAFRDFGALRFVARRIATLSPDVVHGHGAKGAALARLAPHANGAIRVYTPHGGSLVYAPGTLSGGFYRVLDRFLIRRTDLFLFESGYIAQEFRSKIGAPRALVRIVRNGVGEAEFVSVAARPDATDLVCVGELRGVKGFDVLIEALAMLKRSGRRLTATIVGEGPDGGQLTALTQQLGLADQIRFVGHHPAREAFVLGRILVVPSRAESLPYIVLEAAAAGMPIIATRVGGIPEIFGAEAGQLIAADDSAALAHAVGAALDDPARLRGVAQRVNARVRAEFTVNGMVEGGLAAYREALARRKVAQFT
jgi:glycosyltransferase involved in cell wall biosynthesis